MQCLLHAEENQPTVRVELALSTGGQVEGLVAAHDESVIIVVQNKTAYAIAWNEIETSHAFIAKRALLALARDGEKNFTAEDHYELGLFALSRSRGPTAAAQFKLAVKIDSTFEKCTKEAMDEYRNVRRAGAQTTSPPLIKKALELPAQTRSEHNENQSSDSMDNETAPKESPVSDANSQMLLVNMTFGREVQKKMGRDVVLMETDHFLIWTDWTSNTRSLLPKLCEEMYAALSAEFDHKPDKSVFMAKCPVFCWKSKAQFQKFAQLFDGYSGKDAVGYTRSIERHGYVHVALVRHGSDPRDYDRFATTLVHEGTHAFLHRYHSPRLIPHWVNEGYADLMAERVLGDRCFAGEKAKLLAQQYVAHDWPIGDLLAKAGPISVQQYPLAHSIIAFLETRNPQQLKAFVRGLKDGQSIEEALDKNFDGLTTQSLEKQWRAAIHETLKAPAP